MTSRWHIQRMNEDGNWEIDRDFSAPLELKEARELLSELRKWQPKVVRNRVLAKEDV